MSKEKAFRSKRSSTQGKKNATSSQNEPAGNTNNPAGSSPTDAEEVKIPMYQLYLWCFTIPEKCYNPSQLSQLLGGLCKKFVFQLEKGKTEGFLHYQGVLSLKTKEYFAAVKNLLGQEAHIEPCRFWWASVEYCGKSDTKVAGPWTEKSPPLNILVDLLYWQANLLEYLKTHPDDRSILWYYDHWGGAGKTTFSKWLAITLGAQVLTNCKTKDLAFAMDINSSIVVFNLPRKQEDYFNYAALENIKDGLMFSPKYESKTLIFNSPHVVVFANFLPNTEELTKDRWIIKSISGCMRAPSNPIHPLLDPVL